MPKQPGDEEAKDSAHSVDIYASEILDGDGATSSGKDTASSSQSIEGLEDRRRVADHQLLDALLEHLNGRYDQSMERAIASTQSRLSKDPVRLAPDETPRFAETRRSTRRTIGRWVGLVVAASVLVALFSWNRLGPSPTAFAMLEQAYQTSLRSQDREYRVWLEREPLAREMRLNVRGSQCFMVTSVGPLGKSTKIGRDAKGYWFSPPMGPVLTSRSDGLLNTWMDRSSIDMPFLELPTLLERLRSRYDIVGKVEHGSASEMPLLYHVTATLRPNSSPSGEFRKHPELVELWTDFETGVVTKLVLEFSPKDSSRAMRRTTVELINQDEQPSDFYDPVQQNPGRVVIVAP